jgi:hypothetical protein
MTMADVDDINNTMDKLDHRWKMLNEADIDERDRKALQTANCRSLSLSVLSRPRLRILAEIRHALLRKRYKASPGLGDHTGRLRRRTARSRAA